MYPKNSATPNQIAIGPVVQISDGAVQTSGCTVRVLPFGGAEGDGGGTTAYSTDGVVLYTPTQAETNYTSFVLIAKKTGCIPASVTVVTTATATPGTVVVTTNNDKTGYTASTVSDKTGYALAADQAVNVTKWGGTAIASAYVQANAAQFAGQTITCAAGVTILASVGTAATSTAQTGDTYAIVNNGTYGNAQLSRPGTAQTITANQNVNVNQWGGAALPTQFNVAGYASGQDPATLLLVTPANKINTDVANAVKIQKMAVTLAAGDVSGNLPADIKAYTVQPTAALSAAALTTISQLIHGSSYLIVVHDGNNTTSGATLKSTVEGVAAGTLVIVGPGTYALGNAGINAPAADVAMVGAGRGRTIITSSLDLSASGCFVNVPFVRGMTMQGVAASGTYQGPWGASGSKQTVFATYRAVDCLLIGDTDGVYFAAPAATFEALVEGCEIQAKYDAIALNSVNSTVLVNGTRIVAAGPSGAGSGTTARAVVVTNGTIRLRSCELQASGGSTTNLGLRLAAGVATLDGCRVSASGTGAVDLVNDGGTVNVSNTAYASSTGTVTPVYVQGNWLRPTTDGNTLDVTATGEAGVDLSNIKQAASPTTLSNIIVPTVTTLTNAPSVAGQKMDLADTLSDAGVASLKAKLGTIPASGNWNTTVPPTVGQIRTEMETAGGSLATVKGKTDQLTFTTPNVVDSNATVDASAIATALVNAGIGKNTAQEIADAMKTAPSAGTAAAGSVQAKLDSATATADWTATEKAQIRNQLGIDGDKEEPTVTTPTPPIILPPDDPATTTAYLAVYDQDMEALGDVDFSFRLISGPATSGYSYDTGVFTATSASDGLLTVTLLKSSTYLGRRGDGQWVKFLTGSSGTYALPEILGKETM